MTDDELRVKLCELVPNWIIAMNKSACWRKDEQQTVGRWFDPLQDLNAMHEAEKTLTHEQCVEYHRHLDSRQASETYERSDGPDYPAQDFWFHATARQRAEAFIATIS